MSSKTSRLTGRIRNMTKKYKRLHAFLLIISLILNLFPICFYTVKAFIESSATVQKVTLCSTIFIALILTTISLLTKVSLRSTLWVLVIGLYFCLDNVMDMILFIAIFQVVDEMIITPIRKNVKQKLTIHKELDKRL